MNERRIVEQALLVSMLIKVVEGGSMQSMDLGLVSAARDFRLAGNEILSQASTSARPKLLRRIQNYGQKCITPHVLIGAHLPLLGLAVHAILEHLIDEDFLVIVEGSPLSNALDLLLPALQIFAVIESNVQHGQAMASAIFKCFQREGLFAGVSPLGAAPARN